MLTTLKTLRELVSELNVTGGFSQEAIAREVGLTQATISRLKSGEIPDIAYLNGKRIEAMYAKHRRRLPRQKACTELETGK